jgi:triosephosphate isomerase
MVRLKEQRITRSPRRKLVAGNWKMYGALARNEQLLRGLRAALQADRHSDVAVCPPAVYLAQVQSLLAGSAIALGAQDVSAQAEGAFTGEVSAAMLCEFGCRYVIVGHSERRAQHGESDALVAAKFKQALGAGLTPIVCVGETLAERDAGVTEKVVARQLRAVLQLGAEHLVRGVLAYEPVWAIGTGRTATPEQAQAMHAFLRGEIARVDATVAGHLRILYGGSVKAANAAQLFECADVDGGLVGGASLQVEEFAAICAAAG